ncbi:hypothetical protein ASPBRDRAFT_36653 [Aspergillus brasiliensis CBS 101740]|uniref:MGS207 protein n=1 Tax=Aspergillus brasiliensis (strain CBS 101740 / IMI 381727 / IBT 21946) TaxID=767769 RepID=A0A1L9V0I8_ASPBC|nr:hypothetical protein ASPBRDRAFT_36653 [Aspergillus brasiliensis CBS 101740]
MASTSLSPLPFYDIPNLSDERSRTLHALLQQGHREIGLLLGPKLLFHSHVPHKLGSAYSLGASVDQMKEMYQTETVGLNYEKKEDNSLFTRESITRQNWQKFINNKSYTVSFTDFFDREVSQSHGDWKAVVHQYLFDPSYPLINGFIGGLGHPLIHLAYAYELNCPDVATEALSLGCTERDYTFRFMDLPSSGDNTSLKDILMKVHADPRFDNLFDLPGYANIFTIFGAAEPALLEYWQAWNVTDPDRQLEELLDLAALLTISTPTQEHEYDFYFAHMLTVGHAVRLLLPHFPSEWVKPVLRQYWMFVLYMYIAQLRPDVAHLTLPSAVEEDKDWEWVKTQAFCGDFGYDSHRLKVLRALKSAEDTWGWKGGQYLACAVHFVQSFNGWTGFGRGVDGVE